MTATERAKRSDALYYETVSVTRRVLCDMIANREADIEDARADNAKLRELVRFIMHQCNDGNPRCDECIGWNGGECVALQRMRELGVEVDG